MALTGSSKWVAIAGVVLLAFGAILLGEGLFRYFA